MIKEITLVVLLCLLTACGGSDSSSSNNSIDRDARICVSFRDFRVLNTCDFDVNVRTFSGSQALVSVPANGSVPDPDARFPGFFGACRAPFIPVLLTENDSERVNSNDTDDRLREFRCE